MIPVVVTPSRDLELAADLLARAFADDPVMRWMCPDPGRDRLIFRTLLRHAHGREDGVDIAVRDGEPLGASVWDRPGYHQPARAQLAAIPSFLRALGTRFRRGIVLEQECDKARPEGDFWYLAQVGAAVPGVGVGSALLSARLDDLDGPAYLESSNEVNIPLYERFGFEVTGEIELPAGGPRLWPMYRRG